MSVDFMNRIWVKKDKESMWSKSKEPIWKLGRKEIELNNTGLNFRWDWLSACVKKSIRAQTG